MNIYALMPTGLAVIGSLLPWAATSVSGHGSVVRDVCKCESVSTCVVTVASAFCSQTVPCVTANIVPTGSDTPGTCYSPEACNATAVSCGHKSFTVTLTIGACAGNGNPTCCTTTRAADPNANPPIPQGDGCMKFYKGSTALGMQCSGESIVIPLAAPAGHGCDDEGDVTTVVKAKCPADNGIEIEVTATFRCGSCPADLDG